MSDLFLKFMLIQFIFSSPSFIFFNVVFRNHILIPAMSTIERQPIPLSRKFSVDPPKSGGQNDTSLSPYPDPDQRPRRNESTGKVSIIITIQFHNIS